MKNTNNILFIFISLCILFFSCAKPEEELTPYDNIQGLWYYSSECDDNSFDGFVDFLPPAFNVAGEGEGELSITFLDTIMIQASINQDSTIIIPQQALFEFDTLGFSVPINVSGTGFIDSRDKASLILVYSLSVLFIIDEEITCEIDLFRDDDDDDDFSDHLVI